MTKVDIKKLIEYWKKGSDLDFESASDISKHARRYVQASFFIHLSLEKALKAYIVKNSNEHAPYIHNLSALAKKTDLPFSTQQLNLLTEINDFNMRCRYPDATYTIYKKATKIKTETLLKSAQELRQWILEKLNP